MREFFEVDFRYDPESIERYVASVELWIQANDKDELPKCYISPQTTLMGEKLTYVWGTRRVDEDTGLVYRVGRVVLTTNLNWELLYMMVDSLLKVSTYILSRVRNENLLQERDTPGGFLRELFEEDVPL
jgi:hypothetical protein